MKLCKIYIVKHVCVCYSIFIYLKDMFIFVCTEEDIMLDIFTSDLQFNKLANNFS